MHLSAIIIVLAQWLTLALSAQAQNSQSGQSNKDECNIKLNKITGRIFSVQTDESAALKSLMETKILVNYGQYVSYPREDGTFEIDNLPFDSYVVEIAHPAFIYEPARVDITRSGKIRARRVNYIQPSLVQTLSYPLEFRPKTLHNYFMPRETWRIMDLLLNPMVLMMVVPLLIIWVLPKMMNPQEVQQQRESMQMPEYKVPELSEMVANMFGGKPTTSTSQQGTQAITASGSGGSGGGGGGVSSKHGKTKRR